ncbi:hypothetical protein [Methanoculleus methanifontis]|uniref:hypothetical protein n=1 Tax=Methanoculleus methanifontis TaxID=2584086 RepID=UPI00265A02F3|nr:hypothetical protein [Methanoculleus sp. FWC-SCC3]
MAYPSFPLAHILKCCWSPWSVAWRAFAADTVEPASGDKNIPLWRTTVLLN